MTTITRFLGTDLRPGMRPPGSLLVGDNVMLDSQGSVMRRPGLVRHATLPAACAGLYAVDDTLRAVAPEGTSTAGLFPAILLDYVPLATVGGMVQGARLPSGRRAVWIEGAAGGPKVAFTALPPAAVGGSIAAVSCVPWGLVIQGGRLFTLDQNGSLLRWSGVAEPTVNDGLGWANAWGSEATDPRERGGYVASAVLPQALGQYRGRVALFGRSSVELWQQGEEGIDGLSQTIDGAGTGRLGSLAALSGDLLYLDAAGTVRSLTTDANTVTDRESAVGSPVAGLTKDLITPVAVYSREVGAYLLAQGNVIHCLSALPGTGVLGWSRWTLPAEVQVTAMAECRGMLYLRTATALYRIGWGIDQDEVNVGDRRPINVRARTTELRRSDLPQGALAASFLLTGSANLRIVRDGVVPAAGATLTGAGQKPATRRGTWVGRTLAFDLETATAPGSWRWDALSFD